MSNRESEFLCHGSHFPFDILPERKDKLSELFESNATEHITLVVFRMAFEKHPVLGTGIVSRRDRICSDLVGVREEMFKLYSGIAENAGIRCFSAEISLLKRSTYFFFQLRFYID